MVTGQGFRFDPDVLMAFAESTSRMTSMTTEARTGLDAGRELPAGVFGEVGDSSGFVTAFAEYTHRTLAAVGAVEQGIDGLATAVRTYCEQGQRLDEDAATDLRRTESV